MKFFSVTFNSSAETCPDITSFTVTWLLTHLQIYHVPTLCEVLPLSRCVQLCALFLNFLSGKETNSFHLFWNGLSSVVLFAQFLALFLCCDHKFTSTFIHLLLLHDSFILEVNITCGNDSTHPTHEFSKRRLERVWVNLWWTWLKSFFSLL